MNALAPSIKGWCPGALRPMPTGDGLLARVRLSAGRLSLDQAEAIADGARACGNGTIEISSRANLQLRGVRPTQLGELQQRLAALGLIDADPGTERVRNIVASPLADLDPDAAFDVGPIVAALEARLAWDEALRALPGKFGFAVDAGGRLPLWDVEADVRFEASGEGIAVSLAGGPHPRPLPANAGRGEEGGDSPPRPYGEGSGVGLLLDPAEIPDVASRLARAFLSLAGSGPDAPRRMRTLLQRVGAEAVFAAAGLACAPHVRSPRAASPRDAVGSFALGRAFGMGAAPPFGRMSARALAALALAARAQGASGFRVTPSRALIAVGLDGVGAARLGEAAQALGFIVARDDPRLGIVACPGAPACAHAASDAPGDAARLAASLGGSGGLVLHVSGCAKGCARSGPTPITLVATGEGYDLVRSGRAGDVPLHRGLTLPEAAALVKTINEGWAA